MHLILGIMFVLAGSAPVFASDWLPLTGIEIPKALNERNLQYEGASQRFYPSGRTLYNAG